MNKGELTEELRRLLEVARGSGVVMIVMIANEGETAIRTFHNVQCDADAATIMGAVAPLLGRSDA